MILAIVVVLIFVLLIIYSPQKIQNKVIIFDGEKEIVKYSGLNPQSYTEFVNNLELMKSNVNENTDLASQYLYKALENLEDLSFYIYNADLDILEHIKRIIVSIGKDGETLILKYALHKGDHFVPIYLNKL
jgi:hypothetical protein